MDILLAVMAGLVLFLYAISHLSEVIKEASGEKAKNAILTFTSGTLKSLLTGIVVTTILDSSSAVIIITIVLVNAGALNLRQAMGIVLGANIGTTISSQIIALDIGKFSPIFGSGFCHVIDFRFGNYGENRQNYSPFWDVIFWTFYHGGGC